MKDEAEPNHVERLARALEESRRIEKELNNRDLEADAAFADRIAERLGRKDQESA
ncbi:MAG TPA: hypothetical protein VLR26_15205 [Frankiaceae bacterium]|nr:hypothetical protein [Frankiaceae bacterium]